MPDRSITSTITRSLGPDHAGFVFDHAPDGWENRSDCDRMMVLLQGRATERMAEADGEVRRQLRAVRVHLGGLLAAVKERNRVLRDVRPYLPKRS